LTKPLVVNAVEPAPKLSVCPYVFDWLFAVIDKAFWLIDNDVLPLLVLCVASPP
jgi:hypothetical protein